MSYLISYPTWFLNWRTQCERRTGVRVVVPPLFEPITLDEAALHLRLDAIDSPASYADELLVRWQISAAREFCELHMERSLAIQTLELRTDSYAFHNAFPTNGIALPRGPVRRIVQITYINDLGETVFLDDGTGSPTNPQFELDNWTDPARLIPPYNMYWPSGVRMHPGSIRIQYETGYSLPTDSPTEGEPLPWTLRAAILLVLGHLYENREDTAERPPAEIPLGAKALMEPYRNRLGFA